MSRRHGEQAKRLPNSRRKHARAFIESGWYPALLVVLFFLTLMLFDWMDTTWPT